MSTKISLSLLAIAGTLISTEATHAKDLRQNTQALAVNYTSNSLESEMNSLPTPSLVNSSTFSDRDHSASIGNNVSLNGVDQSSEDAPKSNVEEANLDGIESETIPINRDPKELRFESNNSTDRDAVRKLGIAKETTNQTDVFSSDVAVLGSRTETKPNSPAAPPEFSIEIPVPAPHIKSIGTASATAKLPQVTQKIAPVKDVSASEVAVLESHTETDPNSPAAPPEFSIEIPVPAPRTQSIGKVFPSAKLPQVTQKIAPVKDVSASDVAVLESHTATKPNSPSAPPESSIEIPVPAPLTQSIGKVFPTAKLPQVTQKIPTLPIVPTVPPSASIPANSTAAIDPTTTYEPNQQLIYPLLHPAPITSRYGWRTHPLTGKRRFHAGVDLGAPMGAPVVAAGSGTIVSAGWNGGYGKAIVIQHNGVQQTLYGHLSEISVQPGQMVERGTVIGLVGSTGNSSGPHLHFEERESSARGWVAVDPSEEIKYAVQNLQRSAPFVQRDVPAGL